jgi:glycerol-3-phosphate dehydrogenase (NAD(P)+)
MTRVAVMGSGSWGTAFAMILADAGGEVTIWGRDAAVVVDIDTRHVNSRYHPGVILSDRIGATTDASAALAGAALVVLAVPAQSLRGNLNEWVPDLPTEAVLVSLMKGIEVGTSLRMSQVIDEVTGAGSQRIAVVSGPNLAREIAARQPAATTVACADETSARRLQDACSTDYFRPYWTTDVTGVEIGGSVKNVIALANGIAVGMGLGENSQASLITRGLAEMTRLGVALGADPLTFSGLAGVGDLIATCTSSLSRNRSFGVSLGTGLTVAEAEEAMKQTCEAVKSCRAILALAEDAGVEMPITEQIVGVVHEGRSPRGMLAAFMSRSPKAEPGADGLV